MDAERRVPVFLSVIGGRTYALLRNILALAKLGKIPFFGLAETLQEHFEPTRVVFAEWFHFHRWSQAVGESLSNYITELQ